MTYPFEEEYEDSEPSETTEEHAPTVAGPLGQAWSWSPSSLLWVAGGVLAVGFGVWFLMSFNAAKMRAIAEAAVDDGE